MLNYRVMLPVLNYRVPHGSQRDGQTSPHRPRLVVSHSTCPPLFPSPHAYRFCIRYCSNKHTHGGHQVEISSGVSALQASVIAHGSQAVRPGGERRMAQRAHSIAGVGPVRAAEGRERIKGKRKWKMEKYKDRPFWWRMGGV